MSLYNTMYHAKNLTTMLKTSSILFNTLRYRRFQKEPNENAGINLRRKLFKNDQNILDFDVELDDMESDFMNVGALHQEHVAQVELMKKRQKGLIVKQKYFKEKMPNFLTYSEKQQIKHLHSTDPENWTVEKLSDGFPALPSTIIKIIKGNFHKNENKLDNHDNIVKSNWKAFKEGKLENLSLQLVEHLKRFGDRSINLNQFRFNLHAETKKPTERQKCGEFSEIVESYENRSNKLNMLAIGDDVDEQQANEYKPLRNSYMQMKPINFKNKKHITWSELSKSETNEKLELKEVMASDKSSSTNIMVKKYKQSEVAVTKMARDYSHLIYPERIRIPKQKHRKGNLYKLNDCYYDSNGEFLYRVPGMS